MGYRAPDPHRHARYRREDDQRCAALEAKYGVPYEQLPEALRYGHVPTPPRQAAWVAQRRFGYLKQRYGALGGWRQERKHYLAKLEQIRLAEVAVRALRSPRTGRGKPLDRNLKRDALARRARREWREE